MHPTDSVNTGQARRLAAAGLWLMVAMLLLAPARMRAQDDHAAPTPTPESKPLDPKTDPFTLVQPTAADIASRVDKHYNHLHALQLDFVERYRGMGIERVEQGKLLLKKPGFMRWSYSRPRGKLFIIDKHDAYAYTPGDAQAQRIPVEKLDDLRSPLRFLLGHTELGKEMGKLTVSFDGEVAILRGVPVGLEKRMTALELTVSQDGTILGMRMEETGGAETHFQFYGENDKVSPSKDDFVFTPPAGVKIADGLPPM
ncbi:MAG TPA: outer membrane lipoprotein carrier protein LolA [Acidobacteriaceae bacterium]|nr:outer membrane lipoprotein carrier protein LolA [Acidobacteriaceae bacterium]